MSTATSGSASMNKFVRTKESKKLNKQRPPTCANCKKKVQRHLEIHPKKPIYIQIEGPHENPTIHPHETFDKSVHSEKLFRSLPHLTHTHTEKKPQTNAPTKQQ